MAIRLERRRRGAAEGDIEALEREIGTRLPDDYRTFLLESDGGIPETNEFEIPGEDNDSGVNEFLSVAEIRSVRAEDAGRFADDAVPIAHAEGGNLVFLDVASGGVLFWDHEFENARPWRRLASGFGAFWESLQRFDPSTIEVNPEHVKSVWVGPDLLKEYGTDR